jgi:hypothetical protein
MAILVIDTMERMEKGGGGTNPVTGWNSRDSGLRRG